MSKKSPANTRTVLVSGIVGNVLEWYDFALYGYLAPITAELFFPAGDPLTSLMSTFVVFALGFAARPLGGVLFGHVGDRLGRKHLLLASVALMTIPTFLMGLLPTYADVGLLAPILLICLRLIQGISAGGEFIGSITFLVEHAPANRQGFYGSLSNLGAMMGGLLGALGGWLITEFVPADDLHAWGWRLPFLSGIVIGAAAFWLRAGVPDSPAYTEVRAAGRIERQPVQTAFRKYRKPILLTAGLNWFSSAGYYVVFVWFVTDMSKIIGLPLSVAMGIGTAGMLVGLLCTPLMGLLSDRIGRRRFLTWSAAAAALAIVPLLTAASWGTAVSCALAQFGLAILLAAFLGGIPAALVNLHPPEVRCSSLSIGYNLAVALFGGTAPLLSTALIQWTGWAVAPGVYLTAVALLTLWLILTGRPGLPDRVKRGSRSEYV